MRARRNCENNNRGLTLNFNGSVEDKDSLYTEIINDVHSTSYADMKRKALNRPFGGLLQTNLWNEGQIKKLKFIKL